MLRNGPKSTADLSANKRAADVRDRLKSLKQRGEILEIEKGMWEEDHSGRRVSRILDTIREYTAKPGLLCDAKTLAARREQR